MSRKALTKIQERVAGSEEFKEGFSSTEFKRTTARGTVRRATRGVRSQQERHSDKKNEGRKTKERRDKKRGSSRIQVHSRAEIVPAVPGCCIGEEGDRRQFEKVGNRPSQRNKASLSSDERTPHLDQESKGPGK